RQAEERQQQQQRRKDRQIDGLPHLHGGEKDQHRSRNRAGQQRIHHKGRDRHHHDEHHADGPDGQRQFLEAAQHSAAARSRGRRWMHRQSGLFGVARCSGLRGGPNWARGHRAVRSRGQYGGGGGHGFSFSATGFVMPAE